ncbi:uncharacterized protein LOC128960058 [Oppia nitens]|uniref:uncharacterized protein LOC128960058 n=1 Tax=Oppia nitens TaxID=1686743 RepID=UPI0023DBB78F|nr:uncharacterized protein LOC128960058 [Oppia nitens]
MFITIVIIIAIIWLVLKKDKLKEYSNSLGLPITDKRIRYMNVETSKDSTIQTDSYDHKSDEDVNKLKPFVIYEDSDDEDNGVSLKVPSDESDVSDESDKVSILPIVAPVVTPSTSAKTVPLPIEDPEFTLDVA